jgi:2-keto-4-pentenoate hydratase/2-oxohepta-3-ene-1,7-dioic acid hydratase in catechol pathway
VRVARVRLADGRTAVARLHEDVVQVVGDDTLQTLLRALDGEPGDVSTTVSRDSVEFLPPVERPPAVRDFMIFEGHVANARQRTGRDVPEAWYRAPAFYFANPAALVGDNAQVRVPRGCRALDLELEVACIIGAEVSDLSADDPAWLDAIAGFTLMNDWSARDLQAGEMPIGLGPVKGKDFCTSVGPWVVTKDELAEAGTGRWSCEVSAFVNGRRIGGGDIANAYFGWHEVIARASQNTCLVPGDVIGSGTVATGCLLELRELGHRKENPWLAPGDEVELRGGPLGTLRNLIVP